jgi:hypothetical protein
MLRINLVRRIIFADLTFASDGKKFANTCQHCRHLPCHPIAGPLRSESGRKHAALSIAGEWLL